MSRALLLLLLVAVACQDGQLVGPTDAAGPALEHMPLRDRGSTPDRTGRADRARPDGRRPDLPRADLPRPDLPAPCPPGMVQLPAPLGKTCMDLYEAPNVKGQVPLVMYTFPEAEAWCKARSKRLCFDDEWTAACASPTGQNKYPYGIKHKPGTCNDDKKWRLYSQSKLSGWPSSAASTTVTTLAQLLTAAKAAGSKGSVAADHVKWLYQGTAAGAKPGCVGPAGVFDLVGNVEEWTRRKDGGRSQFHGNLKGRYWAEPRTCQSGVKTHADGFRFYEIGFRCCKDAKKP